MKFMFMFLCFSIDSTIYLSMLSKRVFRNVKMRTTIMLLPLFYPKVNNNL